MPKRNYGYEKRQKELSKQQKREEKRQRKLERGGPLPEEVKAEGDEPTSLGGPPEE